MSEQSYSYPLNTKCMLCGKLAGHHNANTKACPVGKARRGFYSYSNTHFFTPTMPRLPKDVNQAITRLQNAIIKATRDSDKLQRSKSKTIDREAESRRILKELDYAQFEFRRTLAQTLGTEKRPTHLVI